MGIDLCIEYEEHEHYSSVFATGGKEKPIYYKGIVAKIPHKQIPRGASRGFLAIARVSCNMFLLFYFSAIDRLINSFIA